ncbi:MAG: hypothetical protein AB7V18_20265 [Pyrinomonadaceae bacterium]
MTISELVGLHTASIGAPDVIAKTSSKVLMGTSMVTSKGQGAIKLTGPVQLASAGDKLLIAMVFDVANYPYEKVAFDGSDISVSRHSGPESPLSFFIRANKTVVKRGIFGGVYNGSWPLLGADKDEDLDYSGTTKIGETVLHKVKYTAPNLGNLTVTLYFEDKTFRHVMTEHKFTASGLMSYSPSGLSSGSSDSPDYYTLIESFGNFAKAGELILPLTYSIEFSSKSASSSRKWTMNFNEAYFNETLEPSVFKVS